MRSTRLLTIIICTYQRAELLASCLESLQKQTAPVDSYEILVVDNAGEPQVKAISRKYSAIYVHEPVTGLSHARNRGWKEASSPWVMFIDDDAIADAGLVEIVLTHINGGQDDMIGGRFTHWFLTPPPKWLLYHYDANGYRPSPATNYGPLPEGHYLVGGILAIRKALLEGLNGFNPNLGMTGKKIGWAEEDELQDRFREKGYRIAYDPAMLIDHLVQPYKYFIRNQLKMAYANGRDGGHDNRPRTIPALLKRLFKILIVNVPYDIVRWMFRPGFYWQNVVVSSGGKIAFLFGMYKNRQWNNG